MYGLLEGIRGGAADMRAANELEANRAYREQMLAMQRAAHEQQVRMNDMRIRDAEMTLRERQGVNDAVQGLRGLQDQDMAARNFMTEAGAKAAEQINQPGGGLPMYLQRAPEAPTERDWLRASTGLAAAKGDVKEMGALRKQGKMLDAYDEADKLASDPAFQDRALDYIHKNELFPIKVKKGTVDPKTGKQLTADVIEFDKDHKFQLAEGDRLKVARGVALMKAGLMDEGLAAIESVNKQLKDVVKAANDKYLQMYQANDLAGGRLRDDQRGDEQLAAQREHWRGMVAASQGRAPKELSAATLEELRALENAWDKASPAERPAIQQKYNMVMSRAGAELGKPRGLGNGPRPERPQISWKDFIETSNGTSVGRDPKTGKEIKFESLSHAEKLRMWHEANGAGGAEAPGGLPDLFNNPPKKQGAIPAGPRAPARDGVTSWLPGAQAPSAGGAPTGGAPIQGMQAAPWVQAEATSDNRPVMMNIGGRQMMVDTSGVLREVSSAPPQAQNSPQGLYAGLRQQLLGPRIQELRQRLEVDDVIRQNGVTPAGGRGVHAGGRPLSPGERRAVEIELAGLMGGR